MPRQSNCLRYRELSSEILLDDAIALSCKVDPRSSPAWGLTPSG